MVGSISIIRPLFHSLSFSSIPFLGLCLCLFLYMCARAKELKAQPESFRSKNKILNEHTIYIEINTRGNVNAQKFGRKAHFSNICLFRFHHNNQSLFSCPSNGEQKKRESISLAMVVYLNLDFCDSCVVIFDSLYFERVHTTQHIRGHAHLNVHCSWTSNFDRFVQFFFVVFYFRLLTISSINKMPPNFHMYAIGST